MSIRIFVANLPFSADDDTLRRHFEQCGRVTEAKVLIDRETQRSRGFGFVEMSDEEGAVAIHKLDGSEMKGRPLVVNEARPQEKRGSGYKQGARRSGSGDRDQQWR